jgi:phosphoglycerate dehydrogenase-like enzyme
MHGTAQAGKWKAIGKTGNELAGKTLAVLGMGRIGKELAKRATGVRHDPDRLRPVYWDEATSPAAMRRSSRCATPATTCFAEADVVSAAPARHRRNPKALISAERTSRRCNPRCHRSSTPRGARIA